MEVGLPSRFSVSRSGYNCNHASRPRFSRRQCFGTKPSLHCSRNQVRGRPRSRGVTAMPALLSCFSSIGRRDPDRTSSSRQSEDQDLMKILIASTPATGHLNPLLAIARHPDCRRPRDHLPDRDRNARSGRKPAERSSACYPGWRTSTRTMSLARAPATQDHSAPGPEWIRVAIERHVRRQSSNRNTMACKTLCRSFPGRRHRRRRHVFRRAADAARPARETTSRRSCAARRFCTGRRQDGAPHFIGLPPATTEAERRRMRRHRERIRQALSISRSPAA